jgi:tRNA dimethylallyltransferase
MKKILTIIGPTASGKTALTVELARKLNGEVIGLDSRQVYDSMIIGTAQPTKEDMDGIPHHLFGFRDPSEPISAGKYAELVRTKIKDIQDNGKMPIICGGAGLYYRALTRGIFEGSVSDLPTRECLEQAYEDDPATLLERLRFVDPEYAEIVHINNKKRLVRALEIYESTGKPPSEHFHHQEEHPSKTLDLFTLLLTWNRGTLYKRIEHRTDEMLEKGWVEEVKTLLEKQTQAGKVYPALDSIGYRQVQAYLNGELTQDEMIDEIIIRTRQFARRQTQWFKKETINLIIEMDNMDRKKLPEILYCIFMTLA